MTPSSSASNHDQKVHCQESHSWWIRLTHSNQDKVHHWDTIIPWMWVDKISKGSKFTLENSNSSTTTYHWGEAAEAQVWNTQGMEEQVIIPSTHQLQSWTWDISSSTIDRTIIQLLHINNRRTSKDKAANGHHWERKWGSRCSTIPISSSQLIGPSINDNY